jgi:hypothetical protein
VPFEFANNTLASPDPRVPVRIRQNFLATEKDCATLRAGVRLVRGIGRQTPLALVHDLRDLAQSGLPVRRHHRRAYPRDRNHGAPPARHLQNGTATRQGVAGMLLV